MVKAASKNEKVRGKNIDKGTLMGAQVLAIYDNAANELGNGKLELGKQLVNDNLAHFL